MTGWSPRLPDLATSAWLAPALLIGVVGVGRVCGWLRVARRWRAGDTRKIFHFAIFATAAVLLSWRGVAAVNLLGGVTALYVGFVVWRGAGYPGYEALARTDDRPRRSLNVTLPLVSTAIGGILAVAFFEGYAAVGFAVTGCGDGIAEPIGTRFGKHKYRVPSLGRRAQRSVEGSAAVLLASTLAAFVALSLAGLAGAHPVAERCTAALVVGVVATVVEAITVHGFDNLTLQVSTSWVAWGMMG